MKNGKKQGKIETGNYKPAVIYQGKREWYVYYFFRNPTTGKFEMFKERAGINRIKNLATRKEQAKALQRFLDDKLKTGWSPFGAVIDVNTEQYEPLTTLLPKLVEAKKARIKKSSYVNYKCYIGKFAEWLKKTGREQLRPVTFKGADAIAYGDYMLNEGINNQTFNNRLAYLKLAFNTLIAREIIEANPFNKLKRLPTESGKNFAFDDTQKEELKKDMLEHDVDLWRFCKFIYHFYIRRSEILSLKVEDFNFKTNHVIVHSGSAKNKKQLAVEIPTSFIDELRSWWNWEELDRSWYLFGHKLKPGPRPWLPVRVSERFKIVRDRLGYDPKYTMYGFKHTGNVDAGLAGVDIVDASRQNRHSNIQQTMEYWRSLGLRPNLEYRNKAPKY